jgi:hypothetical protein
VAQKVADSKGFRGDLGGGIACQPRWFVAEKNLQVSASGAVDDCFRSQRLAF